MVLRRPQKMSEIVPARIIDRLSTTRPFSTKTIAAGGHSAPKTAFRDQRSCALGHKQFGEKTLKCPLIEQERASRETRGVENAGRMESSSAAAAA